MPRAWHARSFCAVLGVVLATSGIRALARTHIYAMEQKAEPHAQSHRQSSNGGKPIGMTAPRIQAQRKFINSDLMQKTIYYVGSVATLVSHFATTRSQSSHIDIGVLQANPCNRAPTRRSEFPPAALVAC